MKLQAAWAEWERWQRGCGTRQSQGRTRGWSWAPDDLKRSCDYPGPIDICTDIATATTRRGGLFRLEFLLSPSMRTDGRLARFSLSPPFSRLVGNATAIRLRDRDSAALSKARFYFARPYPHAAEIKFASQANKEFLVAHGDINSARNSSHDHATDDSEIFRLLVREN